jgi:hypothetical protein
MPRELCVDERQRRILEASVSDPKPERISTEVDVQLNSESKMTLAVGVAQRKAVGRQLRRAELVQVELRLKLSVGTGVRDERPAYDHSYDPAPPHDT